MSTSVGSDLAEGNPFWEFAICAYRQKGVDKALLALQNRLGVDVNMILLCAWLAYRGSNDNLLTQHLNDAVKLSHKWQLNLVQPIRACREHLKVIINEGGLVSRNREVVIALRERIKGNELDLEALEILSLYELIGSHERGDSSDVDSAIQKEQAQKNLNIYFAKVGIEIDQLSQIHVISVLDGIFQ